MLQLRLRLPTGCPHKSMAVDMKSCPEAITVIAEAVPITAEPIQDADAKLYDDAPVAAVCDAAPADAKHCIELEAKEIDVRADPDGVRRRVVVLRDALVRGAPLDLRDDAASGGLEDAAALSLRDADLGRTLLHHAADLGRADAVRELLEYAGSRSREYCAMRDERGNTALDLARDGICAALLRPHDDGAEAK